MKITTNTTKIKDSFQPFSMTINFELKDDAISLMAYLNRSIGEVRYTSKKFLFSDLVDMATIFNVIKTELKNQNIKAYED